MTEKGDYTLKGLRGQELRDQTIGIIGTGRIGMESLKIFSAFTNNILLYDPYPREEAKAMGTYVSLDEIYEKSTLLVFHCPFTKENFHMVNADSIGKMPADVVLVNPARGGLLIIRRFYPVWKKERLVPLQWMFMRMKKPICARI